MAAPDRILLTLGLIAVMLGSTLPSLSSNATSSQIQFHGCVTDLAGNPLPTYVSVTYANGSGVGTAGDSSGCYQLTVNGNQLFYATAAAFPPPVTVANETFYSGYIPEFRLLQTTSPNQQLDFRLPAGGQIWLRGYDTAGHEMYFQDFIGSFSWYAYPLNQSLGTAQTIQQRYQTFPLYYSQNNKLGKAAAVLVLPDGLAAGVWGLWRIPGTGTTFLHADNGTYGFKVSKGAVLAVNIVYEFARTEYAQFSSQYQNLTGKGYQFGSNVTGSLQAATSNLQQAQTYHSSGNEQQAALSAYKVLTSTVGGNEEMQLEKARQDIGRYREFNYALQITDSAGNPISNAKIDYTQQSHDFVFSIGYPNTASQYPLARGAGFEYALNGYFWNDAPGVFTTQPGVYNFTFGRNYLQELTQNNLKLLLLHSMWLTGFTGTSIPSYIRNDTPDQLAAYARDFSLAIMASFRGQVPWFEAYNEPDLNQVFQLNPSQMIKIINASVVGARTSDPRVQTYVNIGLPVPVAFPQYQSSCDAFTNVCLQSYPSPFGTGYDAVSALLKAGVPLSFLGIETYFGTFMPPVDLGLYGQVLDDYGGFGKGVFLSELSYSTLDDYPGLQTYFTAWGGWHQGYTDQAQSGWATGAITLAFSRPYVKGINWMVMDGEPGPGGPQGWSLMHIDDTRPRPALNAIKQLIANWTTAGSGQLDSSGKFAFRGFAGNYSITVSLPNGGPSSFVVHLGANSTQANIVVKAAATTTTTSPTTTSSTGPSSFSSGSTSATTQSSSSTSVSTGTASTSTSTSGESGIPEFPYQLFATTIFASLLVASYLLIKHKRPSGDSSTQ